MYMIMFMTVILVVFLMLIMRVVPLALLWKLMDNIVWCCFRNNLSWNIWLRNSLLNHFFWLFTYTFILRISQNFE